MKKILSFATGLFAAVANAGEIRTYVEQPVWKADNTTTNRVYIYVNNFNTMENTQGVFLDVNSPPYIYNQAGDSFGRPLQNDFFNGSEVTSTYFGFNPVNAWSDYLVETPVNVGNEGFVYFYDVVVGSNAPFGRNGLLISSFSCLFDSNRQPQLGVEVVNGRNAMIVPTLEDFVSQYFGPGQPVTDLRFNLDKSPDNSCTLHDVAELQKMYSFSGN